MTKFILSTYPDVGWGRIYHSKWDKTVLFYYTTLHLHFYLNISGKCWGWGENCAWHRSFFLHTFGEIGGQATNQPRYKIATFKLSVPPISIYTPSDAQLSPPSFGIFKSVCWYGKFVFILVLSLQSVHWIYTPLDAQSWKDRVSWNFRE